MRTATHQEQRPRVRNFEGHRRKASLWPITAKFIGADPIFTLEVTVHVLAAWIHGVATNRLADERGSLCAPVGQSAGFEIKIERFAIGTLRQHAAPLVTGSTHGGNDEHGR